MTANTDPYIEIRPYNDEEIPAALDRLIQDDEFITAILDHRFANKAGWFKTLMSPIVRLYLKAKWSKLDSVEAIQIEVKKYLEDMLDNKVFLELWVKVKSGWADDERALRSLGYGED